MVTIDYTPSKNKGKIITDRITLASIVNHFSVKDETSKFMKTKSGKKLSLRKHAVTEAGNFGPGMVKYILQFLVDSGIRDISITDAFRNRYNGKIDIPFTNTLKSVLYPFQAETVETCLRKGNGIVLIGTGGGKGLIITSLIDHVHRSKQSGKFKCVVVVPGISLVNQVLRDFEKYGAAFTYSAWTGAMELQNTDVVVCNSEYLVRNKDKNWIFDVDLLICDEVHRANSDSILAKLVTKFKTRNIFGFTGTLPPEEFEQWKLVGLFGEVVYEKNSKELRDENYLTQVEVKILGLHHKKPRKMRYRDELTYLYTDKTRNRFISKLVENVKNNTLILVNHHEQAYEILEFLNGISGKTVYFIQGETEVEDRDKIQLLMETENDIVCLAMSSIFSTGISINNIHNIFFVALGKSFIRQVQSIGRGLRLHERKSVLRIFDIYDNFYYSAQHSIKRKEIYDSEQIRWSESLVRLDK